MVAPGAMAPAISISSVTSPSEPFGLPVGAFLLLSSGTDTTLGAFTPSFEKYADRSLVLYPPPS